ncbi:M24 family metallopeptidase, partial [Acinetobacter baumannii]|nr:M24 family metallopeptidase [Acinetobacter baumannii]
IFLTDLKVGQSYYDVVENFTYTFISTEIRAISYGVSETRFYQKYKNEFRLASIERQNGFSIGLRYDHELSYNSIVGGGANACILHYVENNQPLKDGDLVLIDA